MKNLILLSETLLTGSLAPGSTILTSNISPSTFMSGKAGWLWVYFGPVSSTTLDFLLDNGTNSTVGSINITESASKSVGSGVVANYYIPITANNSFNFRVGVTGSSVNILSVWLVTD